jgi:diaminopimelate epimerase
MKTPFWKMSGAGNDFVLLDSSRLKAARAGALARRLCDRRRGIGADGLLLVSRGLALRYLNSDGSEAFCGNGSRCAAAWMADQGWAARGEFDIASNAGTLRARILGRGRAAIAMPAPRLLKQTFSVTAAGRSWNVSHWDTGVPHAVVAVKDVEKVPVFEAGRALRRHRAFGKAGANVDFVQKRGRGLIVRTYERGVEDETLACGTGVVASAAAAQAFGWARLPVRVTVRGGASLRVFREQGHTWLEGPVQTVYTGEIEL